MKLLCLFPSPLSRIMLATCVLSSVAGQAVGEPVQPSPLAVAPAASAASAAAEASVPASGPAPAYMAPYRGRFASACERVNDGLFSIDSVELTPATGPVVDARYRKALYATSRCSAAGLLVTLTLPPATWTFEGQASVAGKTVDLVTVTGQAGNIAATIAQPKKVYEGADRFTIMFGQGGMIPIGKAMDPANHKGLRLIEQGRLYQGNEAPLADNGYPASLNLTSHYTLQKAPKARR